MARLDLIVDEDDGSIVATMTLSRRNLQALWHKLVHMPESARALTSNDCWLNGQPAFDRCFLVILSEDDGRHYSRKLAPPGLMAPETEEFIDRGGAVE